MIMIIMMIMLMVQYIPMYHRLLASSTVCSALNESETMLNTFIDDDYV